MTRAAAVDHVVCSAVVITGRAPFRQICCEVAHVVGLCAHAVCWRGVRRGTPGRTICCEVAHVVGLCAHAVCWRGVPRGTPGRTPALAVVLLNLLCGLSGARLCASGADRTRGVCVRGFFMRYIHIFSHSCSVCFMGLD